MDSIAKKEVRPAVKLWFFGLVVFCVLLGTTLHHKGGPADPTVQAPDLNKAAIKFAAFMIMDDLKTGATGARSMISETSGPEFQEWTGIDLKVTAKEYEAAYDANEIAADNEYKDKKILVSGTLAGIEKDFTGSGYLDLAGTNPFLPGVHAELTSESMGEAASMKKGQRLNLVCTGAGRVVMIALLHDCQPFSDFLSTLTPSVESKINGALSGKTALTAGSAKLIAFLYSAGLSMPADSACLSGNADTCRHELEASFKDLARKQAVMERAKLIEPKIKIAR